MAPLPEDNTARFLVHFTVAGSEHVQQWRVDDLTSPSAMQDFLINVWEAMSPILLLTTINSVGYIPNGSTIENAVAMPSFVGQSYGSGAGTPIQSTGFVDFVGRTTGGRRVRVAFWAPNFVDESFRVTSAEHSEIGDVLVLLNDNAPDLVGIDGIGVVWKPYANWGYNAHWQRAKRS